LRFTSPVVSRSRSDEVAGQHEEHVHADEAAGKGRNAGVEEHDEEDGDSSQTFDIRAE
jgi:hypothetical protein